MKSHRRIAFASLALLFAAGCGSGGEDGRRGPDGAGGRWGGGGVSGAGGSPGGGSSSSGGSPGGSGAASGGAPGGGGTPGNGGGASAGGAIGSGGAGNTGGSESAGPCIPDESEAVPARPRPGEWQRIDIPGAVCSDGSQYPIFVNYSATSNDVVVTFEPGGACWDYASCSPQGGLRGATNPGGIPAGVTHMTGQFAYLPLLRPEPEINPIHDWNKVFVPYCTGDVHTGNNVVTYQGPNGEKIEYRHNGHDNVVRMTKWLNDTFRVIPRLLITGCSSGGAGALLNYHFIREGLAGEQCGYLLDDSGPIFPSSGNSAQLHAKVRESWNVDPIIDSLEKANLGVSASELKQDFGMINVALAKTYRRDRLVFTAYRRDLNYSLYSYESFFGFPPYTRIHELWEEDLTLLRQIYDAHENMAYFIPYFRIDNCSHCLTLPPVGLDRTDLVKALTSPWLGSDIEEKGIGLKQYVIRLLDPTRRLESYVESEQSGEGFTPQQAVVCENQ